MHWLQKKKKEKKKPGLCDLFFFLLEKCHREDLTEEAATMAAAGALFRTGFPFLLSAHCCKQQEPEPVEKSTAPSILRASHIALLSHMFKGTGGKKKKKDKTLVIS